MTIEIEQAPAADLRMNSRQRRNLARKEARLAARREAGRVLIANWPRDGHLDAPADEVGPVEVVE
jgi:hypothetical protein